MQVLVDDGPGCYEWCGRGTNPPYRRIYELVRGPLPPHTVLHHRCENRQCARPSHLEPMTHAEHRRRHAEIRRLRASQKPMSETRREMERALVKQQRVTASLIAMGLEQPPPKPAYPEEPWW